MRRHLGSSFGFFLLCGMETNILFGYCAEIVKMHTKFRSGIQVMFETFCKLF